MPEFKAFARRLTERVLNALGGLRVSPKKGRSFFHFSRRGFWKKEPSLFLVILAFAVIAFFAAPAARAADIEAVLDAMGGAAGSAFTVKNSDKSVTGPVGRLHR